MNRTMSIQMLIPHNIFYSLFLSTETKIWEHGTSLPFKNTVKVRVGKILQNIRDTEFLHDSKNNEQFAALYCAFLIFLVSCFLLSIGKKDYLLKKTSSVSRLILITRTSWCQSKSMQSYRLPKTQQALTLSLYWIVPVFDPTGVRKLL